MANSTEFLLQTQNSDGGWGYRPRGMSYVEPTAAAIIALASSQSSDLSLVHPAIERARSNLVSLQHPDGGWGIGAIDAESGWMTAWAVYGLAKSTGTSLPADRGAEWLFATEGIRATGDDAPAQIRDLYAIDSTLRGWPWLPGDAAWVHPTALAVLALVEAGKRTHPRVSEGVAFLVDRCVSNGGWNIGNPVMLGKTMAPTVQDTAVALLALDAAGAGRTQSPIDLALKYLTTVQMARTPSELAWGALALQAWKMETGEIQSRLQALKRTDGSWQGNPFITAVALVAGAK